MTNLGMFEYQAIPGADPKQAGATGIAVSGLRIPQRGSRCRVGAHDRAGAGKVPGSGRPESCANPTPSASWTSPLRPRRRWRASSARACPSDQRCTAAAARRAFSAAAGRVFVANANDDTHHSDRRRRRNTVEGEIPIRIPGLEAYRGVLPIGMAYHEKSGWLLVAEAGINAVGVIDVEQRRVLGHIPAAWFPTRVACTIANGVCGQRARVRAGSECAARAGAARLGLDVPDARRQRIWRRKTAFVMDANGFRAGPTAGAPAARRHQARGADRQGESHLR